MKISYLVDMIYTCGGDRSQGQHYHEANMKDLSTGNLMLFTKFQISSAFKKLSRSEIL